jgi:hypothetical protein
LLDDRESNQIAIEWDCKGNRYACADERVARTLRPAF